MPATSSTSRPDAMTPCSTPGGSFLPPLAASTASSTRYPPSRAGSGRILTAARLMLTIAQNWNSPAASVRAISEPAATMATGPDSWPTIFEKFVTIWTSPLKTVPLSLLNSAVAMENTSPGLSALMWLMKALEESCTPIRPLPFATSGTQSTCTSSPSRCTMNSICLPGLSRMRPTTPATCSGAAGTSRPSTLSSRSPSLKPARAAAEPLTTSGIRTPGRKAVSALPTVLTWTRRARYAKMMFAMTPALITAARSPMDRFLSRSGSSGSKPDWEAGSSSGNAT
mmetsp:Transcript_36656/g.81575  ORF Transcript_36656/g.81575 Transcript_36656/m.81575 type:complete len:283 (-) Transcript_36656:607-1455(-)